MKWLNVAAIIVLNIIVSLRYVTVCQNNGYKIPLNKPFLSNFLYIAVSTVPSLVFYLLTVFIPEYGQDFLLANSIYCLALALLFLVYNMYRKTKFSPTQRGIITYVFSNYWALFSIILCALFINNYLLVCFIDSAVLLLFPVFLFVSLGVLNPIFSHKNKRFVRKQMQRLNECNIIKIGITGSFGKTSCKNILTQLLPKKFDVLATPHNYNTPMGIALTVNDLDGQDIFIAEMGARRVGDISELVEMVKPDIGIITGVTTQHLETFQSLHNIYLEKQKLAKVVEAKGICIFNANDRYALKMYKEHNGRKLKVCINKSGDISAQNITLSGKGSSFDIIDKKQKYHCATKLLGKHNIQNILMCVGVCVYLGMELEDIVEEISELKPTPHRLQLISNNGLNIIDDSYNSNIRGIEYSLECLKKFDTKRIVLSQGIVEQGKATEATNNEVGRMLAKVANVVMLCGSNAKFIKNGLNSENFEGEIYEYATLADAKKDFHRVLRSGDTLLIQNDIPDTM